jgi:hypothetical protein
MMRIPVDAVESTLKNYKSIKAEAWFIAALYLEDRDYPSSALQDHILKIIVPALKRRADIIERKHRSNQTA